MRKNSDKSCKIRLMVLRIEVKRANLKVKKILGPLQLIYRTWRTSNSKRHKKKSLYTKRKTEKSETKQQYSTTLKISLANSII
jgi:hypothetical protein